MSTPTITTVGGWITIAVVVGGVYYLSGNKEKTRRPTISKQTPKASEPKKDTKSRRTKKVSPQSDGDSEVKSGSEKKQKKQTPQPGKVQEPVYTSSSKDNAAEEENNIDFARRMAKAKTGAIAAPASKSESRQKSVKQNKAQEKVAAETSSDNITAPSSANGGDADDDRSPVASPDLSATSVESPVTNGGISDMLEKPAPGPSVLNITAPVNPVPAKVSRQQSAPESVETKKQRQNRQKAEAKKLARQEEEVERQKLLEQQRRTARLAEGRAAKDGSTFMASRAPATSSWAAAPPAVNGSAPSKPSNVELLDTIDNTSSSTTPVASSKAAGSGGQKAAGSWQSSLPSEEEQIRLISENDNWETVKTKERKSKGNKTAKENRNPKEDSSADENREHGIPQKDSISGAGKKWEATLVHVDENKKVVERQVELEDSEWEVS